MFIREVNSFFGLGRVAFMTPFFTFSFAELVTSRLAGGKALLDINCEISISTCKDKLGVVAKM